MKPSFTSRLYFLGAAFMLIQAGFAEDRGVTHIESETSIGESSQPIAIKVRDDLGRPVKGVEIRTGGTADNVITDANGLAVFILPGPWCVVGEGPVTPLQRFEGSVTLVTKEGKEFAIDLAKEFGDEFNPQYGKWVPYLQVKLNAGGVPKLVGDRRPLMEREAVAFRDALTPEQREKAIATFESAERENWHYVPKTRGGISLKELNDEQRKAAISLVKSVLSEQGFIKVETIMALEAVLADLENNPRVRDAGLYTVTIFGTPGDAKGWGWRFEGHHISINMTVVDGKTAVTPTFLGANPAEVTEGPLKGTRALRSEEDRARMLVSLLIESGKPVVFSEKAPAEILTAADRKVKQLEPVGVAQAEMSDTQKLILHNLIGSYVDRYKEGIAAEEWATIKAAGLENIRFGWAGGVKRGEAFYYRIQGPTFLIEAANSQNNANHMHTVWRDFDGDFGRDLLGEHYHGHDH